MTSQRAFSLSLQPHDKSVINRSLLLQKDGGGSRNRTLAIHPNPSVAAKLRILDPQRGTLCSKFINSNSSIM